MEVNLSSRKAKSLLKQACEVFPQDKELATLFAKVEEVEKKKKEAIQLKKQSDKYRKELEASLPKLKIDVHKHLESENNVIKGLSNK